MTATVETASVRQKFDAPHQLTEEQTEPHAEDGYVKLRPVLDSA